MAALKVIFEGSEVFSNEEESTSVGVYLHLAAMPDQDIVRQPRNAPMHMHMHIYM